MTAFQQDPDANEAFRKYQAQMRAAIGSQLKMVLIGVVIAICCMPRSPTCPRAM